jgi:hypothetical protein
VEAGGDAGLAQEARLDRGARSDGLRESDGALEVVVLGAEEAAVAPFGDDAIRQVAPWVYKGQIR